LENSIGEIRILLIIVCMVILETQGVARVLYEFEILWSNVRLDSLEQQEENLGMMSRLDISESINLVRWMRLGVGRKTDELTFTSKEMKSLIDVIDHYKDSVKFGRLEESGAKIWMTIYSKRATR